MPSLHGCSPYEGAGLHLSFRSATHEMNPNATISTVNIGQQYNAEERIARMLLR